MSVDLQAPPRRIASRANTMVSLRSIRRHFTFESITGHGHEVAEPQTQYIQVAFPCYDLPWEALKEYLEGKWPGERFSTRPRRERDSWIFETPKPGLSQDDYINIAKLRERKSADRKSGKRPREAVSRERGVTT